MKVKKSKNRQTDDCEAIELDEEVQGAARRLRALIDEVNTILVDRKEELSAIELCLITKQHLMLEGPPGVAKTLLADLVFNQLASEGVTYFKKQLMANTTTDEIFGPLDAKKYREDAEYTVRTEGYLPSAHFAFLDEVYRAANMVLPAILGVLNEREYVNGLQHLKCPLHTAIGTTNFTSDNPELEAFHDRWLVRVKCQPLGTSLARLKLLNSFLSLEERTEQLSHNVTLHDLNLLNKAIKAVVVEDHYMQLYEDLVSGLKRALPNLYISDRRYCQAFRLCNAAYLVEGAVEFVPLLFYFTRFGLIAVNNREHSEAFESVFSATVGSYAHHSEFVAKIIKVEKLSRKLELEYDDELSADELVNLYVRVRRGLSAMSDLDLSIINDPFVLEKIDGIKKRFNSLADTISPNVDIDRVKQAVAKFSV